MKEDPFDLDRFAELMSEPWTCCRCQRTFTPLPDDPKSIPVAIQTEAVPAGKNWPGEFFQKKVGDICYDCMNPSAAGLRTNGETNA